MRSRVFRIFISSTFDDMGAERHALAERVFPALEAAARDRGAEFRVIDLRWGVTAEAMSSQRTRRICLDEIARCQAVSPRPNFIALIGQRYGHCPLPESIPAAVFEQLTLMTRGDARVDTLLSWYAMDRNAVPGEFVLRERHGIFLAEDEWRAAVVAPIHSLLREASVTLDWTEEERISYTGSLTHQECLHGACLSTRAVPGSAFCYMRTIDDIDDCDPAAALRPVEQRREYVVRFTDSDSKAAYLDTLCADVLNDLRGVMALEAAVSDPTDEESAEHDQRQSVLNRAFIGRERFVGEIVATLAKGSGRCVQLVGGAGSGKSSVLAHVAEILARDASNPVVAIRFSGLTPGTVTVAGVLRSLIREVARQIGVPTPRLPLDADSLIATLERLIGDSTNRRVYLFLDDFTPLDTHHAIAQLAHGAGGAVVCLSAPPGNSETRAQLPIPDLTPDEAGLILRQRLSDIQRSVTTEQSQRLLNEAGSTPSPRWVTIAARYAATLRSFDPVQPIGRTVEEAGRRLVSMRTQSQTSDPLLVLNVLRDVACSRFGLTEQELVSLLEDDIAVLDSIRATSKHDLPVAGGRTRIPTVVWSQVLQELEPFLERQHQGRSGVLRLTDDFGEGFLGAELANRNVGRLRAGVRDESGCG
jgi:hypothetical protein